MLSDEIAAFSRWYGQPIVFPVDIIEGQVSQLYTAHAIGGQELDDGDISLAFSVAGIDVIEERVDIAGGDRLWDRGLSIPRGLGHEIREILGAKPFVESEAQEDANFTKHVAIGAWSAFLLDSVSKVLIEPLGAEIFEWVFLRVAFEPFEKSLPIDLALLDVNFRDLIDMSCR